MFFGCFIVVVPCLAPHKSTKDSSFRVYQTKEKTTESVSVPFPLSLSHTQAFAPTPQSDFAYLLLFRFYSRNKKQNAQNTFLSPRSHSLFSLFISRPAPRAISSSPLFCERKISQYSIPPRGARKDSSFSSSIHQFNHRASDAKTKNQLKLQNTPKYNRQNADHTENPSTTDFPAGRRSHRNGKIPPPPVRGPKYRIIIYLCIIYSLRSFWVRRPLSHSLLALHDDVGNGAQRAHLRGSRLCLSSQFAKTHLCR